MFTLSFSHKKEMGREKHKARGGTDKNVIFLNGPKIYSELSNI